MYKLLLIVSTWCILAVASAVVSVKVTWIQIPFMVSINSCFLFCFFYVLDKVTSTNETLDDSSPIQQAYDASPNKPSATIIQQLDVAAEHTKVESGQSTNHVLFAKLVLTHLLHQYSNFAIGCWIGNANLIQVIRNFEPSVTYLIFSKKHVKVDVILHSVTTICIACIQLWSVPSSWLPIILVLMNSQLLSYRNTLLRQWHSENHPSHEMTKILRTISMIAIVLMAIIYTTLNQYLTLVVWEWKWLAFAASGHSIYLTYNIVLLKLWNVVLYASASLVKRAFVTIVLLSFSWYTIHHFSFAIHFSAFVIGGLGIAAGSYICAIHVDSTRRTLFSTICFVVISLLMAIFLFGSLFAGHVNHNSEKLGITTPLIPAQTQHPISKDPLRVLIYTAAGNNNLGDNVQIHSWVSHFNSLNRRKFNGERKIDIYSLSSEACCYVFDDTRKFTARTISRFGEVIGQVKPDYLFVGGGALLSHPHEPLSLENATYDWTELVIKPYPKTKWVFAAVGADGAGGYGYSERVSALLNNAHVLTVRDPISQNNFRHVVTRNQPVSIVNDPILTDGVNYPFPDEKEENHVEKVNCWILRKPIPNDQYNLIKPYVGDKDLFFAFEAQDGNYDGKFKNTVSLYSTEGDWFWYNLKRHCKFVITTRFHASIFAFRALIPSMAIELENLENPDWYSQKIRALYNALLGNHDCVLKFMNADSFNEKFYGCQLEFNKELVKRKILEMEKGFQDFMDQTVQ